MAARAIWKGIVNIGAETVPVNLYSAVQDKTVHFRLLHESDQEPVKQKLISADSSKDVDRASVRKAYAVGSDRFVVFQDEELETLEPKESRDIEVLQFVDQKEMDPRWYERAYWLSPDKSNESYFALAAALENKGREGIARWVMRKKSYVGSLRQEQGYLMLITLRHADEMISAGSLHKPEGRDLSAKELEMGEQLLSVLAGKFDPAEFQDEYRNRVMELIEAKSKGKRPKVEKFKPRKNTEDELTGVLEASLAGLKKVSGAR